VTGAANQKAIRVVGLGRGAFHHRPRKGTRPIQNKTPLFWRFSGNRGQVALTRENQRVAKRGAGPRERFAGESGTPGPKTVTLERGGTFFKRGFPPKANEKPPPLGKPGHKLLSGKNSYRGGKNLCCGKIKKPKFGGGARVPFSGRGPSSAGSACSPGGTKNTPKKKPPRALQNFDDCFQRVWGGGGGAPYAHRLLGDKRKKKNREPRYSKGGGRGGVG